MTTGSTYKVVNWLVPPQRPLTGSVCSFIVRSIPEGLMFREFSSIWEIQAKRH